MSEVVYLDCETTLDIPADRVLEQAAGNMEYAIVIGKHKNGDFYFASSIGSHPDILWELEQAKKFLLNL